MTRAGLVCREGCLCQSDCYPLLHEPGQPGAAIFIWRLEAARMSSVLPAVLFLAFFICQAARQG